MVSYYPPEGRSLHRKALFPEQSLSFQLKSFFSPFQLFQGSLSSSTLFFRTLQEGNLALNFFVADYSFFSFSGSINTGSFLSIQGPPPPPFASPPDIFKLIFPLFFCFFSTVSTSIPLPIMEDWVTALWFFPFLSSYFPTLFLPFKFSQPLEIKSRTFQAFLSPIFPSLSFTVPPFFFWFFFPPVFLFPWLSPFGFPQGSTLRDPLFIESNSRSSINPPLYLSSRLLPPDEHFSPRSDFLR